MVFEYLTSRGLINEAIMRIAIQIAASVFVLAFFKHNLAGTGYGLMTAAIVQAIAALLLADRHPDNKPRRNAETGFIIASMVIIASSVSAMIADQPVVVWLRTNRLWHLATTQEKVT